MEPKPKHLGKQYADQFQDASVVATYRHRPAYPPQTDLCTGTLRTLSDRPEAR